MRFPILACLLALVPGCGGNQEAEFRAVADKAMAELKIKTSAHQSLWEIGKADRWNLDQDQGLLTFTFPDKTVSAEAQIIGSYNQAKGTWLWSWDNPSVLPNLTQSSLKVREYGKEHGFAKLTKSSWSGTEDEAWEAAALAMFVSGAQGVYRGPAGDVFVFITFGEPRIQKRN